MINAFGGLGGFVGTYVVGALGGGTSAVPYVFLAACLLMAAVLMFVVRPPGRAGQRAPGLIRQQARTPLPAELAARRSATRAER